jgi:hypothetical protein
MIQEPVETAKRSGFIRGGIKGSRAQVGTGNKSEDKLWAWAGSSLMVLGSGWVKF